MILSKLNSQPDTAHFVFWLSSTIIYPGAECYSSYEMAHRAASCLPRIHPSSFLSKVLRALLFLYTFNIGNITPNFLPEQVIRSKINFYYHRVLIILDQLYQLQSIKMINELFIQYYARGATLILCILRSSIFSTLLFHFWDVDISKHSVGYDLNFLISQSEFEFFSKFII